MAPTQVNREQMTYWNEQAGPRWVRWQQQLDAQINHLGLVAMQRAEVKPGEHVLDVGCGCGQTSLQLAERVGPHGSVVGIDISRPMLARARERHRELQVDNLLFLHADAQTYAFERGRFDLVFSRFGVMFFEDPPAAFRNLRTALRADGRLCFLCWQALEKNDWARIPLLAATRYVQPPPSAPDAPGPFAFADPERVRRILTAGGFQDIRCESYDTSVSLGGATNVDEAVAFALEIGPVAMLLREASAQTRVQVAEAIRAALIPYASDGQVSLGGATWIVQARPA